MSRRVTIAVLLLCVLLAGCNRSRKRVIAVVPKGTAHLFWVSVHAGAMAAGEDLGVEVLWNGTNQETEYARQIQIVDSMIARRVDGLALAAADRNALVQAVDRVVAAGIPVTIFDSGLDGQNYTSFVATNNVEAGQMAARTLA
ncbi:MAG: substrate-binding domain-containing protein, partial [Bryobacteraceae bacterium]